MNTGDFSSAPYWREFVCCAQKNLVVLRNRDTIGSTVLVRLHDGREVEAKVTAIVDSVLGRKAHISYGVLALKVDPTQIIRTLQ
jgi:hypothetical protein